MISQPPSSDRSGQRAVVIDIETTDKTDPHLIEVAYGYITDCGDFLDETLYEQRFNPGVPSKFGALMTHHILDSDLVGMPDPSKFCLPSDVGYIIGHNVKFDSKVLGLNGLVREIDTLLLSQKAFPDVDSHRQGAVFYYLTAMHGLDMHAARALAQQAHGAGSDIKMCATIFKYLVAWSERYADRIQKHSGASTLGVFERMHLLTEAARFPLVMTFGKHEGERPWQTPASYRGWFARQPDADPYVIMAMNKGSNAETEAGIRLYELANAIYGGPPQQTQLEPASPHEQVWPAQRKFTFQRPTG